MGADDFEGQFTQQISEINKYLENGTQYLADLHKSNLAEELMILMNISVNLRVSTDGGISLNNTSVIDSNNYCITSLTAQWPRKAPSFGRLQRERRCPSTSMPMTQCIWAMSWAQPIWERLCLDCRTCDTTGIEKYLQTCMVPPWSIDKKNENRREWGGGKENGNEIEDYDSEVKGLVQSLPQRKEFIGMKLKCAEFEKDNGTFDARLNRAIQEFDIDEMRDLTIMANKMTNSNNNLHFLSRGMVNWDERYLSIFTMKSFLRHKIWSFTKWPVNWKILLFNCKES